MSNALPKTTAESLPSETERVSPRRPFDTSLTNTLSSLSPVALAVVLALLTLPFYFFGLGELEFFRHTEADRTLIAWEMQERGDYIVPHLLGTPILTKPPLFYWLIAASLWFFGEVSEWVARFPSAVAASLLVVLQFAFVLKATRDRLFAFTAAIVLGTGVHFLTLGSLAEIDMTFGLLCSATLYGVYFFLDRPSLLRAVGTATIGALAFLTKGPPVVFFAGAAFVGFLLWTLRTPSATRAERPGLVPSVTFFLAGVVIFFGCLSLWLLTLADRVGMPEIIRQWDVEVFQRVFSPAKHQRGPLFYLGSALSGLLPWSVLAILFPLFLQKRFRDQLTVSDREKGFVAFSAITAFLALLMLTFAEGKSSRYLFPVYPFFANLLAWSLFQIPTLKLQWLFFRLAQALAVVGFVAAVGMPVIPPIMGVPRTNLFLVSAVIIPVTLLLFRSAQMRRGVSVVALLVATMVCFRVFEKAVFIPHRNAVRSVSAVAATINNSVPAGTSIYTVEMFERWLVFSLKRLDRHVVRIKTADLDRLPKDEPVYLLLSQKDEWWRLLQLQRATPETVLVSDLKHSFDHFLLVRAPVRALHALNISDDYDPEPTEPPAEFASLSPDGSELKSPAP